MRAPEQLSAEAGQPGTAAGKAYEANGIVVTRTTEDGVTHLNLLDASTHREQELPVAGTVPAGLMWAHDGRRLVYHGLDRNVGAGVQLFALDTATGESRRISAGDDWRALDWSLDDRMVLALRTSSDGTAELLQLDAATLQSQVLKLRLTATRPQRRAPQRAGRVRILQARYSSDRHSVLALAAAPGQAARLWRQAIDGSEPATALSPLLASDIEYFDQSADGRYIAFSYNEGGYGRLALLDQRSASPRLVTALPSGSINALKFDHTGTQLAVNVEGPGLPAEMQVLDVASFALVRWTQAELGPLSVTELSVPATVRVPSWSAAGTRLPAALVYKPASGGRARLPVLISLPESITAPRAHFNAQSQALVNALGCALIVPTLRVATNTAEGRELALRDIAALLVWIGQQPEFDRAHVAIEGAADSAPVALAALALFSDRLRGAIVSDTASVVVPTQAIERPVLLLRGVSASPAPFGVIEQLMWRLRVPGNDTWVLATTIGQTAPMNRTQALEAARVRAQFLRGLFSAG
jgi:dipeptidyl aminopeptidase/acylaminoacyl peptidase